MYSSTYPGYIPAPTPDIFQHLPGYIPAPTPDVFQHVPWIYSSTYPLDVFQHLPGYIPAPTMDIFQHLPWMYSSTYPDVFQHLPWIYSSTYPDIFQHPPWIYSSTYPGYIPAPTRIYSSIGIRETKRELEPTHHPDSVSAITSLVQRLRNQRSTYSRAIVARSCTFLTSKSRSRRCVVNRSEKDARIRLLRDQKRDKNAVIFHRARRIRRSPDARRRRRRADVSVVAHRASVTNNERLRSGEAVVDGGYYGANHKVGALPLTLVT